VAANLELQLTKAVGNVSRQPMDLPQAQIPEGRVHVIAERCKECSFCITYCPTEVLIYSDEINAKGYHYPIVADGKETACVHCRFCDLICPELAIYTTEITDEDDAKGKPDGG
jgi:2-oxoglutarate ferredoxin oxidoreductase subunit delta